MRSRERLYPGEAEAVLYQLGGDSDVYTPVVASSCGEFLGVLRGWQRKRGAVLEVVCRRPTAGIAAYEIPPVSIETLTLHWKLWVNGRTGASWWWLEAPRGETAETLKRVRGFR